MHSPLEIARNYIEVGIHKVNLSIYKMVLLGFLAGIFIGFAGIASTTASSTISSPSAAKLLGAAVFPAGMAMVLIAGSELFTGNCMITISLLEKQAGLAGMVRNLAVVYGGNFVGAALLAVPMLSLLCCALCGFSISLMWPGVLSSTAAVYPKGGAAMFGLLAVCGDMGCSAGPALAGMVSEFAGLRTGMLSAVIFPAVMVLCLLFSMAKKPHSPS